MVVGSRFSIRTSFRLGAVRPSGEVLPRPRPHASLPKSPRIRQTRRVASVILSGGFMSDILDGHLSHGAVFVSVGIVMSGGKLVQVPRHDHVNGLCLDFVLGATTWLRSPTWASRSRCSTPRRPRRATTPGWRPAALCGGKDRHCFELGIGDALILPCPACGTENGLDAHDRADTSCRSCGSPVPFPEPLKAKKQLLACYDCLRAGKAAMTKDTEFGMVSWDQAFHGVTNGVPGLSTDQFEMVPIDPEEDWFGVRVPSEHLWELLRTPGLNSWQGERWLFCCRSPMTYLGGWRNVVESLRPERPAGPSSRGSSTPKTRRGRWDTSDSSWGTPACTSTAADRAADAGHLGLRLNQRVCSDRGRRRRLKRW